MTPEQAIIIVAHAAFRRVSYLLVFFAGFIAGLFGLILLGHITSWMQSKKRAKYREFKMGDDLFDVEIPNFLPHDEENKD